MKNKFWPGFFSGLILAILVVTVGFGRAQGLPKISNIFNKEEESQDLEDIVDKLESLEIGRASCRERV